MSNDIYPKRRDLDRCYFRVERDGKFYNRCFTDLTDEERELVTEGQGETWLKDLLFHLADSIQRLGAEFYISEVDQDE